MNPVTFNILLSILTLVITVTGGYLVNFLRQKIGNENINNYYKIAKQIVMAIEQSNSQLSGIYKKELAIKKIIEFSNNKLTDKQADVLIESAVYELKKILTNNN